MRHLAAADFVPPRAPPPLASGEIHLWFFPHWQESRDAAAAPEVRQLLASYAERAPDTLRIERGEQGKPRLAGTALHFNLSHSAGALLLGISRDSELGVDLESAARRTRAVPELARRWFASREADALSALPPAQQQAAFLQLWTCKEAALKCLGSGISFGLHRVEFELDTAGRVCGLRNAPASGQAWQVLALAPGPAHIGALAWRGKPAVVHAFTQLAIAAAAQSG
jgi:4'-phosphopantetheinyl transferase